MTNFKNSDLNNLEETKNKILTEQIMLMSYKNELNELDRNQKEQTALLLQKVELFESTTIENFRKLEEGIQNVIHSKINEFKEKYCSNSKLTKNNK